MRKTLLRSLAGLIVVLAIGWLVNKPTGYVISAGRDGPACYETDTWTEVPMSYCQ